MGHEISDFNTWVDQYGDILFRFATLRVRDASVAEDLVQEALMAGIKSAKNFKGQSTERSWLIGILKHKILDYYRKSSRENNVSQYLDEEGNFESFFDQQMMSANHKAPEWAGDPSGSMEKEEFWNVFRSCLNNIPQKLSQVFAMREIDGVSTDEICKELNITSTNVWVILHRARAGLKGCLEKNWFGNNKDSR
ncbi:MAG: RNA polymerase subunit sigma-70 [Planctomycetota bacterium]|nr:MAG: RNA polymerase subunit sigma-70 [Planctomycetota bacterium]